MADPSGFRSSAQKEEAMPSISRIFDVSSSIASSLIRAASGSSVGIVGERPAEPVILYEFEGCPYCRKVR